MQYISNPITYQQHIKDQLEVLQPGEYTILETAGKSYPHIRATVYWAQKEMGTKYKTIRYFDDSFHVQRVK